MNTNTLIANVIEWGREKKLHDPNKQFIKLVEEVGEVAHEISRNRYNSLAIEDGIGDTLVTIIILADILGYNPMECLELAYNEIKNRTGETKDGTFIKNS